VNGDDAGTARSGMGAAYQRCAEAIAARDVNAFFTEDNKASVLDPDDRPVRRRAHVRERGVWVRTPEGWVQVEGQFLESPEITVDGTPVGAKADPWVVRLTRRSALVPERSAHLSPASRRRPCARTWTGR
jgi:hypothetical protein